MTRHDNVLRTIDLARAGHISVQQVRNYEASGFIPPARRSSSGYRLYTQQHLAALKTARSLIASYGRQRAWDIMQAVHQSKLPIALSLIDEHHATLAGKRLQIEQTLAALRTLATQSTHLTGTRHAQRLRVGEAAKQVGVRISALHFWEQQGLLHPVRDRESRYRLYDEQQMRRLHVVVLLREAGYDFNVIQPVLDEMETGQPEKAIAAVEKKHAELARTTWSCLAALSSFQDYVNEFSREAVSSL